MQSLTNFVKSAQLFRAGTAAVHKFSLCFVCMDQWASWQQCMEVRKAITPDLNCHKNEEKIENKMF